MFNSHLNRVTKISLYALSLRSNVESIGIKRSECQGGISQKKRDQQLSKINRFGSFTILITINEIISVLTYQLLLTNSRLKILIFFSFKRLLGLHKYQIIKTPTMIQEHQQLPKKILRIPCIHQFKSETKGYFQGILTVSPEGFFLDISQGKFEDIEKLKLERSQSGSLNLSISHKKVSLKLPICFQSNKDQIMIILNPHCYVRTLEKFADAIQKFLSTDYALPVIRVPSKQIQQYASQYGQELFAHCGTFNRQHNCVIKIYESFYASSKDNQNEQNRHFKISIYNGSQEISKPTNGVPNMQTNSFKWQNGDVFYFWKVSALFTFNSILKKVGLQNQKLQSQQNQKTKITTQFQGYIHTQNQLGQGQKSNRQLLQDNTIFLDKRAAQQSQPIPKQSDDGYHKLHKENQIQGDGHNSEKKSIEEQNDSYRLQQEINKKQIFEQNFTTIKPHQNQRKQPQSPENLLKTIEQSLKNTKYEISKVEGKEVYHQKEIPFQKQQKCDKIQNEDEINFLQNDKLQQQEDQQNIQVQLKDKQPFMKQGSQKSNKSNVNQNQSQNMIKQQERKIIGNEGQIRNEEQQIRRQEQIRENMQMQVQVQDPSKMAMQQEQPIHIQKDKQMPYIQKIIEQEQNISQININIKQSEAQQNVEVQFKSENACDKRQQSGAEFEVGTKNRFGQEFKKIEQIKVQRPDLSSRKQDESLKQRSMEQQCILQVTQLQNFVQKHKQQQHKSQHQILEGIKSDKKQYQNENQQKTNAKPTIGFGKENSQERSWSSPTYQINFTPFRLMQNYGQSLQKGTQQSIKEVQQQKFQGRPQIKGAQKDKLANFESINIFKNYQAQKQDASESKFQIQKQQPKKNTQFDMQVQNNTNEVTFKASCEVLHKQNNQLREPRKDEKKQSPSQKSNELLNYDDDQMSLQNVFAVEKQQQQDLKNQPTQKQPQQDKHKQNNPKSEQKVQQNNQKIQSVVQTQKLESRQKLPSQQKQILEIQQWVASYDSSKPFLIQYKKSNAIQSPNKAINEKNMQQVADNNKQEQPQIKQHIKQGYHKIQGSKELAEVPRTEKSNQKSMPIVSINSELDGQMGKQSNNPLKRRLICKEKKKNKHKDVILQLSSSEQSPSEKRKHNKDVPKSIVSTLKKRIVNQVYKIQIISQKIDEKLESRKESQPITLKDKQIEKCLKEQQSIVRKQIQKVQSPVDKHAPEIQSILNLSKEQKKEEQPKIVQKAVSKQKQKAAQQENGQQARMAEVSSKIETKRTKQKKAQTSKLQSRIKRSQRLNKIDINIKEQKTKRRYQRRSTQREKQEDSQSQEKNVDSRQRSREKPQRIVINNQRTTRHSKSRLVSSSIKIKRQKQKKSFVMDLRNKVDRSFDKPHMIHQKRNYNKKKLQHCSQNQQSFCSEQSQYNFYHHLLRPYQKKCISLDHNANIQVHKVELLDQTFQLKDGLIITKAVPFELNHTIQLKVMLNRAKNKIRQNSEFICRTFDIHPTADSRIITHQDYANNIYQFDLEKQSLVSSYHYNPEGSSSYTSSSSTGCIMDLKYHISDGNTFLAITPNNFFIGDKRHKKTVAELDVLRFYKSEAGFNKIAINPQNANQVALSSKYGAVRLYDVRYDAKKIIQAKNRYSISNKIINMQATTSNSGDLLLSYKDKIQILPTCNQLFQKNIRHKDRQQIHSLAMPKRIIRRYDPQQTGKKFDLTAAHYNQNSTQIITVCGQNIIRWDAEKETFKHDKIPQEHRKGKIYYCNYFGQDFQGGENVIYGCDEGLMLTSLTK